MKKIIHIFNILLITILVYFCTSAFYKITKSIFGQKLNCPVSHAYNKQQQDQKLKPLTDYKTIIDRNLFNTNKHSDQINNLPDTENLPETDLKLKLWGTVVGITEKAYAVIEETESKTQNLYRQGDKIQQATITRILREMVILRINGRDEILEMEDSLKNKLAYAPEEPPDNEDVSADEKDIHIDRRLIDKAIEGKNFLKDAKIIPDFSNPKALGLKIVEINPESIISQFGIKEGDIIMSLDGHKFRKTKEIIDYYRSRPSSEGMSVEIIRSGQEMSIHYNLY